MAVETGQKLRCFQTRNLVRVKTEVLLLSQDAESFTLADEINNNIADIVHRFALLL